MKRPIYFILLPLMLWIVQPAYAYRVPATVTYCGIELNLTTGAQKQIGEYVAEIQRSEYYFNQMVERAAIYMPIIEDALRMGGVPEDLKYLSIQESALRADVESKSAAVGFWQFKEPTGEEMGLIINGKIDERMHLIRSTEAAAKYLSQNNHDFDNWVYAVISYYEGPTGAIPYTQPKYYGKSRMTVDKKLHWYVMKSIAHKLAYEDALDRSPEPVIWLVPYRTQGELVVKNLIKRHNISEAQFKEYNKWIRSGNKLPEPGDFTYFIPETTAPALIAATETPAPEDKPQKTGIYSTTGSMYAASVSGLRRNSGREAQPAIAFPEAWFFDEESGEPVQFFTPERDIRHGVDYVVIKPGESLQDISTRYGIPSGSLGLWNDLDSESHLVPGRALAIKPLNKMHYHIVAEGEGLDDIAVRYGLSYRKLQKKNRMDATNTRIYVGQKLNLKKKKPKGEPVLLLKNAYKKPEPTPVITTPKSPQSHKTVFENTMEEAEPELLDVETRWIEYRVQTGDTLWDLSRRYKTKVEIIKHINELESDALEPGQILRILVRD